MKHMFHCSKHSIFSLSHWIASGFKPLIFSNLTLKICWLPRFQLVVQHLQWPNWPPAVQALLKCPEVEGAATEMACSMADKAGFWEAFPQGVLDVTRSRIFLKLSNLIGCVYLTWHDSSGWDHPYWPKHLSDWDSEVRGIWNLDEFGDCIFPSHCDYFHGFAWNSALAMTTYMHIYIYAYTPAI